MPPPPLFQARSQRTPILTSEKGDAEAAASFLRERCVVDHIFEDGPAERAGMKTGDVVLAVNDESSNLMGIFEFRREPQRAGGKRDEGVKLRLWRVVSQM